MAEIRRQFDQKNRQLDAESAARIKANEGAVPAAWADGQIGGVALLAAVWAAAQAVFIRAGIANEVAKGQQ